MATMRMKESKFGAPVGIYRAKFLGVQPMTQKPGEGPRLGRDGKPMEPGIEWQFEIVDGDARGQIVGRITSQAPTTKNSCGVLLAGLVGRAIRPDEDVDPDQYRGTLYQVVIGQSKENPERTQVTQIVKEGGGAPPPQPSAPPRPANVPPAPPVPPAGTPAPPPPPSPAPQRQTDAEPEYWVNDGHESRKMTGTAIRDLLKTGALKQEQIQLSSIDGSTGWKPVAHFGLDVPF